MAIRQGIFLISERGEKNVAASQGLTANSLIGTGFKVALQSHYRSQKSIRLLILQRAKEIHIKDFYTYLAIIGEEKKKRRKKR